MPEPADSSAPSLRNYLLAQFDHAIAFLLRERSRRVVCWLVALGSLGFAAEQAWTAFDDGERQDGNWGHATIDFGGQWLMGRMIVEGHGRHLYDRRYLRRVVEAHYPAGVESPKAERTDVEALMAWLAGGDDTDPPVGGALYPPVQALNYAPLALLEPRPAYRVLQAIILALVLLDGWLVQRITSGRVWWPIASVLLLMFPGFYGCLDLGQNGLVSLTLLLLGWWRLMRGREAAAGVWWGLLAFKPVWAVSFFLVPLLTGRRRMAFAMALTGLVQIGLTLPVVGGESWKNWVQVGRMAAVDYTRQENWIVLSRDLLGIPRRWLYVFEDSVTKRLVWQPESAGKGDGPPPEAHPLPAALGWGLWAAVLAGTLFVAWRGRRRMGESSGPAPAFALSGAMLLCYHFMYYDFVLAVLPMVLLFTEPLRYLRARFWRRPRWLGGRGQEEVLPAEMWPYYQPAWDDWWPPPLPLLPDGRRPRWVLAPMPPLLLVLMMSLPALGWYFDSRFHSPPWETFALILVWVWCGIQVFARSAGDGRCDPPLALRANGMAADAEQLAEPGAGVVGTHERLADQHGADAGRL